MWFATKARRPPIAVTTAINMKIWMKGWVPLLRWVGGRGEGDVSPSHPPQKRDFSLFCGGGAVSPLPPTAKEGKNPSFVVGERGELPPPPFPLQPTAKEGPTPYKGWALQHGGHTPISLEYQIQPPPTTVDTLVTGMIIIIWALMGYDWISGWGMVFVKYMFNLTKGPVYPEWHLF